MEEFDQSAKRIAEELTALRRRCEARFIEVKLVACQMAVPHDGLGQTADVRLVRYANAVRLEVRRAGHWRPLEYFPDEIDALGAAAESRALHSACLPELRALEPFTFELVQRGAEASPQPAQPFRRGTRWSGGRLVRLPGASHKAWLTPR